MHGRANSPSAEVLVVDDDTGWINMVADCLRREKMSLVIAANDQDGLAAAERIRPQIVIVSLDLPGVGTLQLCRRLRAAGDAHIIAMARHCDEATTVAGLAAGADDVLTKPFTGREVAARIRAILRRHRTAPPQTAPPPSGELSGKWVFGPLSVDVSRREVFVADEQIKLTRTQFEILTTLAQRPGALTTRQELLDSVWGPCWSGSPNIIDVHIGQLRRKLGDDPARPLLVLNVRGKGYRLAG